MKLRSYTGIALVTLSSLAFAAETSSSFDLDFSGSQCFGVSPHRIQVNQIRLDTIVSNPLLPRPQVVSISFDVPFEFDFNTLHFVPVLDGMVVDDPTNSQTCALDVTVKDAVTGLAVPNASVLLGGASQVADSTGVARFSAVSPGVVNVSTSSDGYTPGTDSLTVSCPDTNAMTVALNPSTMRPDQVRIVLTWGETPYDLDAHLTGPQSGAERFHVYWDQRGDEAANLDVDDIDSHGPETVTISPAAGSGQLRAGLYRYSVYDYQSINPSSANIGTDTTVKLYVGNQPARTFRPSGNASVLGGNHGDLWTVFELMVADDGSVSVLPIDSYTPASGSANAVLRSAVQSTLPKYGYGAAEMPQVFADMPQK